MAIVGSILKFLPPSEPWGTWGSWCGMMQESHVFLRNTFAVDIYDLDSNYWWFGKGSVSTISLGSPRRRLVDRPHQRSLRLSLTRSQPLLQAWNWPGPIFCVPPKFDMFYGGSVVSFAHRKIATIGLSRLQVFRGLFLIPGMDRSGPRLCCCW